MFLRRGYDRLQHVPAHDKNRRGCGFALTGRVHNSNHCKCVQVYCRDC